MNIFRCIAILLCTKECVGNSDETYSDIKFVALDSGDTLTGDIEEKTSVISLVDCAKGCSGQCIGYKYGTLNGGTCELVRKNYYGETTESTSEAKVWKRDCSQEMDVAVEFQPVYYQNFEEPLCLDLINAAELTTGKTGDFAVKTNRNQNQWVDLGYITEACITRPETCTSGGTIAAWIKTTSCPHDGGILSSNRGSSYTGFNMYCFLSFHEYKIWLADGHFQDKIFRSLNDWKHIVLVYHGPNSGEGFTVYENGVEVLRQTMRTAVNTVRTPGDGGMVIGRKEVNTDNDYSSVEVDDLAMWNFQLSPQQIQTISAVV